MLGELINVYSGPMVGNTLLFVPINGVAALLTLLLIMRIGKGKLNIPIIILCLGFLISAAIPVVFGVGYLWAVLLTQTLFGILSILAIMKVFGVFSQIFKFEKPSLVLRSDAEVSETELPQE